MGGERKPPREERLDEGVRIRPNEPWEKPAPAQDQKPAPKPPDEKKP